MGEAMLDYFERLSKLFWSVEVADGRRSRVDLAVGLAAAVDLIVSQASLGRKMIFIGNGGSAAIASHQAVDFWKNGGIRAVAFNDASLLTCISNDFGYREVFAKPIEMFADAGDVLIAISSSGRSENILSAVSTARARDCRAVTLSGFSPETPLRFVGDVNFYVPSNSYGHVEIVHLALCHCILDTIISRQNLA